MSDLSRLFNTSGNDGADDLDALFTMPAAEVLPAGVYAVELTRGGLGKSKSGKDRYELRARVGDGEHVGRTLFDDFYLTPSAWWKSGPLLKKLGITSPEQCRRDLPTGLLARVRLTIEEHDGTRRNKIADITLIGRKPDDDTGAAPVVATPTPSTPSPVAAAADPFAPVPSAEAGRGDAWEPPNVVADALGFSFGHNVEGGPYAAGGERR